MGEQGQYDVCMVIDGDTTISDVGKIFDALEDKEIYVDYATLNFENSLGFECRTREENVELIVDEISKTYKGLAIDWDAMEDYDF